MSLLQWAKWCERFPWRWNSKGKNKKVQFLCSGSHAQRLQKCHSVKTLGGAEGTFWRITFSEVPRGTRTQVISWSCPSAYPRPNSDNIFLNAATSQICLIITKHQRCFAPNQSNTDIVFSDRTQGVWGFVSAFSRLGTEGFWGEVGGRVISLNALWYRHVWPVCCVRIGFCMGFVVGADIYWKKCIWKNVKLGLKMWPLKRRITVRVTAFNKNPSAE